MKALFFIILIFVQPSMAEIQIGRRIYATPVFGIPITHRDGTVEIINPAVVLPGKTTLKGISADMESARYVCAAIGRKLVSFRRERLYWWFSLVKFSPEGAISRRKTYWKILTISCR